ncbi:mannosyltransferase, partial [Thioclava sp. BHET1]
MPDEPSPPLDRAAFKARLREIRARIHAGDTCAARQALEALERLPDLATLDSPTVLGPPRKLVAARLSLAKAEGDEVARAGYQYHLVPDPALWTPHLAQSEAERQAALAAAGQTVPRVIHQIWIGPRAAPANCAAWARHAPALGYRYHL